MALGTEQANNTTTTGSANWREVVSQIKEAGRGIERDPDHRSLREFVRTLLQYKQEYATSKEVIREVLHQISTLKNSPYLQAHVFEPSNDLSRPQGDIGEVLDSSHYESQDAKKYQASEVVVANGYYAQEGAPKAQAQQASTAPPPSKLNKSFYYASESRASPTPTGGYTDTSQMVTSTPTSGYADNQPVPLSTSGYMDNQPLPPSLPTQTSSPALLDENAVNIVPLSPSISKPKARNWSLEFWRALELKFNSPEESYNRSNTIKRIAADFCAVATRHGRTIISEMFLPSTAIRTIPSIDAGGMAGGLKYLKDGIFFKFAVDNLGIYAGDHNAMKAAGHELKGLAAFMNCQIPGLRVPLMAIVDYRGFRLIATSALPISSVLPSASALFNIPVPTHPVMKPIVLADGRVIVDNSERPAIATVQTIVPRSPSSNSLARSASSSSASLTDSNNSIVPRSPSSSSLSRSSSSPSPLSLSTSTSSVSSTISTPPSVIYGASVPENTIYGSGITPVIYGSDTAPASNTPHGATLPNSTNFGSATIPSPVIYGSGTVPASNTIYGATIPDSTIYGSATIPAPATVPASNTTKGAAISDSPIYGRAATPGGITTIPDSTIYGSGAIPTPVIYGSAVPASDNKGATIPDSPVYGIAATTKDAAIPDSTIYGSGIAPVIYGSSAVPASNTSKGVIHDSPIYGRAAAPGAAIPDSTIYGSATIPTPTPVPASTMKGAAIPDSPIYGRAEAPGGIATIPDSTIYGGATIPTPVIYGASNTIKGSTIPDSPIYGRAAAPDSSTIPDSTIYGSATIPTPTPTPVLSNTTKGAAILDSPVYGRAAPGGATIPDSTIYGSGIPTPVIYGSATVTPSNTNNAASIPDSPIYGRAAAPGGVTTHDSTIYGSGIPNPVLATPSTITNPTSYANASTNSTIYGNASTPTTSAIYGSSIPSSPASHANSTAPSTPIDLSNYYGTPISPAPSTPTNISNYIATPINISNYLTPITPATPSTPSTPISPPSPPTPHVFTPTEHPKGMSPFSPSNSNNDQPITPTRTTPTRKTTIPLLQEGNSLLTTFNSLKLTPNAKTSSRYEILPTAGEEEEIEEEEEEELGINGLVGEGGEVEIPKHTLVYGSCDGGATVYNIDPTMHQLMKRAAEILNLKGHVVGSRLKTEIYGPCDLEGHRIRNGEYVILDTARTFPPERPSSTSQHGAHLIRLLRPELVRSNRCPLSSDAYTSFGSSDPAQPTHNKEVEQAQQRLVCEIIPNFVLAANQKVKKIEAGLSIFEVASQLNLIDSLHREGINVRYLPALKRTDVHGLELRLTTIINTEIMARRAKNRLRAYLRANLKEFAARNTELSALAEFSEKEIQALVDFFNTTIIAAELQGQDMDGYSVPLLIERLTAMSGIHLHQDTMSRLENGELLTKIDIVSVTPRVRYLHTVPYQEGVAMYHQASALPPNEAKQLLTIAEQKFKTALGAKPDDPAILTHWGMLLIQKSRLYHELARKKQILEAAIEKFKEAVQVKRNNHYALFNWAEALREMSQTEVGSQSSALLVKATEKMREAGVFQKKWFFGTLPTNGAAGLLAHQPAHSFFIRNSNTRPGHFVFSHLTRDRKIKHTLILYDTNGKYTLARQGAQAYSTLEDFVMAKIGEGYSVVTKKWWD